MVMLYPMSLFVRTRTEVVPAELPPVIPAIEGDMATFEGVTTKEISAVTDWVILKLLTIALPTVGSKRRKVENTKISDNTVEVNDLSILVEIRLKIAI